MHIECGSRESFVGGRAAMNGYRQVNGSCARSYPGWTKGGGSRRLGWGFDCGGTTTSLSAVGSTRIRTANLQMYHGTNHMKRRALSFKALFRNTCTTYMINFHSSPTMGARQLRSARSYPLGDISASSPKDPQVALSPSRKA